MGSLLYVYEVSCQLTHAITYLSLTYNDNKVPYKGNFEKGAQRIQTCSRPIYGPITIRVKRLQNPPLSAKLPCREALWSELTYYDILKR